MLLTLLAIPFILFGAFVKPYEQPFKRCISVNQTPFCFEQGSSMPEVIKYGSVLVGFGFLYAGRRMIRRKRGETG
jgi:hypothetical protein